MPFACQNGCSTFWGETAIVQFVQPLFYVVLQPPPATQRAGAGTGVILAFVHDQVFAAAGENSPAFFAMIRFVAENADGGNALRFKRRERLPYCEAEEVCCA